MLALAIEFIRVHLMARNSLSRFGGNCGGETPGPIPNPEVKPSSADGTALETGWESRSPPRLLAKSRLRAALPRSGTLPPCPVSTVDPIVRRRLLRDGRRSARVLS